MQYQMQYRLADGFTPANKLRLRAAIGGRIVPS
jgi:hypothetical protein